MMYGENDWEKEYIKKWKDINAKIEKEETLNDEEAYYILENVIDFLIELDNGAWSRKENDKCVKYLLAFKNLWFFKNDSVKKNLEVVEG
jgi:hypothetical protein